jgi:hypothetical protein
LLLALTSSPAQAQLMIGNPNTGQGVVIGPNGVTPTYGYNNYGGYAAPGTSYYNSGYRAPGLMTPNGYYNGNVYRGYRTSAYRYPTNRGRVYTYPGTTYRRGLFGRVRTR